LFNNVQFRKGITLSILVLLFGVSIYPTITGEVPDNQLSEENKTLYSKFDSSAYCSIEENETIVDGIDDVIDLSTQEIVTEHPDIDVENIDITKITYNRMDKNVSVVLNVVGLIEDRGNISDFTRGMSFDIDAVGYFLLLATSSEVYQIIYANKVCQMIYMSSSETVNLSDDDFSVSNDTLTVSFELLTADEIYDEIISQAVYHKIDFSYPPEWVFLIDEAPNPPLWVDAYVPGWGIVNKEIMFESFVYGGSPPWSYHWDFGDGENSTEKNPTHVYNRIGKYVYNLTVTDNVSFSSSFSGEIEIIKHSFVIGIISNKNTSGNITSFDSLNVWWINVFPFSIKHFTQGEKIKLFKPYLGIVSQRFICGFYYVIPGSGSFPPIYSLNIFSKDDSANKIIWLVSAVEGNPLEIYKVEPVLLNESDIPQPDAEITFEDTTGTGYIEPQAKHFI